MAKTSSIEKNNRRRKMTKKFAAKRARLKAIAYDKERPLEERFEAQLKLAQLPRNSSATGRPMSFSATGPAPRPWSGSRTTSSSFRCRPNLPSRPPMESWS